MTPSARFPLPGRPFLWGVAVSHYQVEGDDPCDWTAWEASGKTKGGPCGKAVGAWQRYEEDAALAARLGANAFRFSVSWSRVEPRRGVFDEGALARYRRLVERLTALGLEPVVTLLHYTHPAWFHDETPWTSPRSVEAFARFSRRVAEALGPAVRCFTILNEPLVLVLGGYVDGQIPPGVADGRAARAALDHLLAGHAAAAAAIRETSPLAAIGIAHNMMGFVADRGLHPLDRALARYADWFYNRGLLEAFVTGRWRLFLPPATRLSGRRDELAGTLDFVGVNYYSRLHMRFAVEKGRVGAFAYRDRTGRGLTDNGWEIVPEALSGILRTAASFGLPLLVSENGLADGSDTSRARFLADHAGAVRKARAEGIALGGYLHWSLVDNFEWLDGYGPKFGLFEVDRETMERRPRPSSAVFSALGRELLAGSPTP